MSRLEAAYQRDTATIIALRSAARDAREVIGLTADIADACDLLPTYLRAGLRAALARINHALDQPSTQPEIVHEQGTL
jgi:hypothetical protein